MAKEAFISILETDLRLLSSESRKSDSLAGQLAGWLSNSEHPEVKEAAERAVLKLRAFSRQPDCIEAIQNSTELLKPFALACETKNAKLVTLALGCIQKLLSNDAVSAEGRSSVVAVLQHVEKSNDEGVNLKMLQTALTLLQGPAIADSEDDICQVLGLCFRSLANARKKETVYSTAAATVRQAVALIFNRALPPDDWPRNDPRSEGAESHSVGHTTVLGRTRAALHLLEDLCHFACGNHAKWMHSPVIELEFVLKVLQFVMSGNPEIFKISPHFEEVLRERVCHVAFQLLSAVTSSEPELSRKPEAHAMYKTVATLLSNFYMLIPAKESQFISLLIQCLKPTVPNVQRMCCLYVLHEVASQPEHLYYLFVTYDMKLDYQLNAWHDLVVSSESIIQSYFASSLEDSEELGFNNLSALYKARGRRGWSIDEDIEQGAASMATLALDLLLRVGQAIATLTESLSKNTDSDALSPRTPRIAVDGTLVVQRHICVLMVDDSWKMLLNAFQAVINHGCGEYLVLELLKGYQSILHACASLHIIPALNAFLGSLCDLSLPLNIGADSMHHAGSMSIVLPPSPTVLTPVNMQALRTLFNVVQELGNSLGSSWVLVVETLNRLDEILQSPKTTTQEVALVHEVPTSGQRSELSILETSVDWLFESSKMMTTDSVVSLLSALRDVSCQSIPAASTGIGATRFALSRMADVLLQNLHRIHDLWGVFLTHIIEIINSTTKDCRTEAVLALDRAITGSIGEHSVPDPGEREGDPSMVMDTAVENMLLVALESLYRDVSEQDAQKGILTIAFHVLQHHGESLTRGWTPILRMLEAVPMTGDHELIVTGFESIELIMNDYISLLPVDLKRRCFEVASGYGNQTLALNVSLSTVSLLWSATDQLGKSGGGAMLERSPEQGSPRPGHAVLVPDTKQDSSLLFAVFNILRLLSLDRRPEVRNSAIRTYFSVLVSHSSHLNNESWAVCLDESILPLVASVYHLSVTSSSEEAKPTVIGKDQDGKRVEMIVHHSRNSERKQWDESLVLTFNGLGKVLRTSLPQLVSLHNFSEAWEKIMDTCKTAIAKGTREVAAAGIGLVITVIQDHVASGVITPIMMKYMFYGLKEGIAAMAHDSSTAQTAVRSEMVLAIGVILSTLRECLSVPDLKMMLGWVDELIRYPFCPSDSPSQTYGCLPNVQKEALAVLSSFISLENPEIWVSVARLYCAQLYPPSLEVSSVLCRPSERKALPGALSSLWMERVVVELAKLFKDRDAMNLRGVVFGEIIASLTRCMVTWYFLEDQQLWRLACDAFASTVGCGLAAINTPGTGEEESRNQFSWEILAECFEGFLLGKDVAEGQELRMFFEDQSVEPPPQLGQPLSNSEAKHAVLDTLTDVVLISCDHATTKIKQRLISIVDEGVGLPEDPISGSTGTLNHACLRKMYVMCSRGRTGCLLDVARLAVPVFIARCESTLSQFIRAEQRDAHLPSSIVDKVIFLLDILKSLAISIDVIEPTFKKHHHVVTIVQAVENRAVVRAQHQRSVSSAEFIRNSNSEQGKEARIEGRHLLLLYDVLISCITTKEPRVRRMVQDLLKIVGEYLGISRYSMDT